MAHQISMEAGLAGCREKLGELVYEAVLLRITIQELEAENAELRARQPAVPAVEPTRVQPVGSRSYTTDDVSS